MIPPSLHYPADRTDSAEQWEVLSARLFDELFVARHATIPPAPVDLWIEWSKWEHFAPECGPNVVSKDTVREWLQAYEASFDANGLVLSVYARSAALLLSQQTKTARVPVVVAQDGKPAQILQLEITAIEGGAGHDWLHPSFEHRSADVSAGKGQFAEAITACWSLAHGSSHLNVFWQLRSADGGSLPLMKLDGPSASAAAYRAFWHLAEGKVIDPDVYVLADATSSDGSIKAVGHLREKIQAIKNTHSAHSQHSPTLVAATTVSADDTAALKAACDWAEVVLVGTVDEFIAVRSCVATAAIDYLALLVEKLNPLLLPGTTRQVRLSDVHVPAHVWKEERRMAAFAEASDDQAGEKDWRPAGYDPAVADREAGPRLEQAKRQVRVSWETEFRRTHRTSPLVLVGGPGMGKTTVLRWTARQMALESVAQLASRQQSLHGISWPVLAVLAAWAEQTEQPRESLIKATLATHPVPETWPPLRQASLRLLLSERLFTAIERTFIFFDALDQVGEGYETKLRDWFTQLTDFTSRLVLTTRESGNRTHGTIMNHFPQPTYLQTAALTSDEAGELAAKWLGTEQAARLQGHLRSHPSLSLVADSPLLLTLACIVQSSQPQQSLPETPAELYQEMMRSLARGDWRASSASAARVADPDDLIASLERIAWRLFVRSPGVNRFERSVIVDAIEKATGSPLLATLVDLGFLESAGREAREEHFHFRHTTFLEFLAASHLAHGLNRDGWPVSEVESWQPAAGWQKVRTSALLDAQAFEPAWEPLIVFTAGLMKEPLPLIEVLADRKKDDLYGHRLGLLCRCCGSIVAQKESQLLDLLRSVLMQMAQIGHRAVRRRPERWRRWLENIGALLGLPHTSQEAVQLLVSLATGRHEGKMHGDHEILELLVAKASSSNFGAALDAMLKLCTEDLEGHTRDKMAIALVECAEKNGAHDYVEKLETLVNELGDKPWQQVAIYGGLLASRDSSVVGRATGFLKAKAHDWGAEEWVRLSAAHQLINLMGREQEMRVAPVLLDKIFKSFAVSAGDTGSHSFAFDVVSAALQRPSDFGLALALLILRTHSHAGFLAYRCCEVLVKAEDLNIQQIGLSFLREEIGNIREEASGEYSCNSAAAKLLAMLGGNTGKHEATEYLWAVTDFPVTRGWSQFRAIETLLEIGIPYDQRMHNVFKRCSECSSVEHGVLAMMGRKARDNGDSEILDLVAHQLKCVVEAAASANSSNTLGSFERDRAAEALVNTKYGKSLEEAAFARLHEGAHENANAAWFSVSTVAYGASSSAILDVLPVLFREGKMVFRPWHKLLRELTKRGWRLRLRGRQIEVLRRGQEEPRADADFGY